MPMLGVHKNMHSDKIKLRSSLTTLYLAGDVGVMSFNFLAEKSVVKQYYQAYEYSIT